MGTLQAVLITAGTVDDMAVSGEAGDVCVRGGDVGGTRDVKGLYLYTSVAARTVEANEDNVGSVVEVSTRTLHPLADRRVATGSTVDDDAIRAEDRLEDRSEGKDGRVMAGAGETDAVHAGGVVARAESADGRVRYGRGTVVADHNRARPLGDKGENEQIQSNGYRKVRRILKGEEGRRGGRG